MPNGSMTTNLRTFVAVSTIGAIGFGTPNVFAKPLHSSPNLHRSTQPNLTRTTVLTPEEEYGLQESLARCKAIIRDEEVRKLFGQFVEEWVRDTENSSDPQSELIHPSYHRILAMGTSVLPFIFDDMARGDGAKWLPALDAITLGRVNPIRPEHQDDAILICQDWLEWAKTNEFLAD